MELIRKYFTELTPEQDERLAALLPLYQEWNAQINVISRKDLEHFYERHVLHSISIANVIRFKPGTAVLDVGTGGGFPGIPLAILFPKVQFTLIDSIGKKVKVVNAVAQSLHLQNVNGLQIRAEEVQENFDFVVSRAVTRLSPLYHWVKKRIHTKSVNTLDNGILCLKGGDLTEELSELNLKKKLYNLSDFFSESFFETKKIAYIPFYS